MDAKRIGSVLMVGLLLLSAMVVFTGTVAAEKYAVMFYGHITDEGGRDMANANVNIVLLDKYWWNATTNGDGYYEVTEKYEEPPGNVPNIRTEQTYCMYIDGNYAGCKQLIANTEASKSDFTWVSSRSPNCNCKWTYPWSTTHEIPEFSTIAIPVASILGLLFFFNRRKHRKE